MKTAQVSRILQPSIVIRKSRKSSIHNRVPAKGVCPDFLRKSFAGMQLASLRHRRSDAQMTFFGCTTVNTEVRGKSRSSFLLGGSPSASPWRKRRRFCPCAS